MFGQRCNGVLRDRAGGGGCPRFRTRSKELGHFEKVSGRGAWFIAKLEYAQIAREICPTRLINGFEESVLMPLCVLGGINVDVPLLGEVLKNCRFLGGDGGSTIRRFGHRCRVGSD